MIRTTKFYPLRASFAASEIRFVLITSLFHFRQSYRFGRWLEMVVNRLQLLSTTDMTARRKFVGVFVISLVFFCFLTVKKGTFYQTDCGPQNARFSAPEPIILHFSDGEYKSVIQTLEEINSQVSRTTL